ncbi:hypothetical protein BG842_09875 [Haladaptatus sp. W1]|uniref:hypothetical protein n=1 Tax=Haladaptatus sp. W1 TaxID=1897478 RepID=UPI000849A715|nr:hypothetical protein [Haladaptatus sp. W1]ODR79324.1 hypothetical protein BG842_09875 [Haladaptatus sp. W1]
MLCRGTPRRAIPPTTGLGGIGVGEDAEDAGFVVATDAHAVVEDGQSEWQLVVDVQVELSALDGRLGRIVVVVEDLVDNRGEIDDFGSHAVEDAVADLVHVHRRDGGRIEPAERPGVA